MSGNPDGKIGGVFLTRTQQSMFSNNSCSQKYRSRGKRPVIVSAGGVRERRRIEAAFWKVFSRIPNTSKGVTDDARRNRTTNPSAAIECGRFSVSARNVGHVHPSPNKILEAVTQSQVRSTLGAADIRLKMRTPETLEKSVNGMRASCVAKVRGI